MRALALLAVVAFLAGCGDDSPAPMAEKQAESREQRPATEPEAAPKPAAAVRVVDSQFGRILADRRGQALYLFAKETSARSECYGECAKAWPPLFTDGKPVARSGARRGLLGTTKRRDGRLQVTYRGHPVYLYEHDSPGKVLCHNVPEFGGLWLVVQPNGRPAPA